MFDAGHHRVAICGLLPCIASTMVFPIIEVRYDLRQNLRKHVPSADRARHRPWCPGHIQAIICRFISRDTPDVFTASRLKDEARPRLIGNTGADRAARRKQRKEEFSGGLIHHLILHGADILTGYGVENRPTCPSLIISRIASFGLSGPTRLSAADQFSHQLSFS